MSTNGYLEWAIRNTKTSWWHDSADPAELQIGLDRGAVGVTTNPYLSNVALAGNRELWREQIDEVLSQNLDKGPKAEALMRIPVTNAAKAVMPEFKASNGTRGYVCAQVNPAFHGDRDIMLPMARRFHDWAPNIAVKLPATAAGLDVLEECAAEGITTALTVSFTVPQILAIGERHRLGVERAKAKGITEARCYAVIMIGRLDDYLRDVVHDNGADIGESDIQMAGLAVTKRGYSIYQERGYTAELLVAALRGDHHMTELTGADLIMSIHPKSMGSLVGDELPKEERIDVPVPPSVIERLNKLPEFVRAYEPDGMVPNEFIGFGATQRTLTQFLEIGWKPMEGFK
jgi:transaldolase